MKKQVFLLCLLCCSFWLLQVDANDNSTPDFKFLIGNQEEILNNGHSRALNNAYEFAHNYWITTTDRIENAQMNAPLDRISMAKMLSKYAIKILKKTPDISAKCSFSDVPEALDLSYDHWVKLACQLGIMWMGIDTFRPYETTTRADYFMIF